MKASNKNTLREITKSKSRFLSIFLICAIGVGFFSGVRAAGGDMRLSADRYFDKTDLFDLRVVSTFGLTDNDLEAIRELDGVDSAYASKFTDLVVRRGEKELTTRVYSQLPDEINTIKINEGRNIQADNEAVINKNMFDESVNIGDTVLLEDVSGAETFPLKYREYTIVGIYETPMFISKTQHGSTTIGNGKLDALMIVPQDHFTQEPYTEIYIRCGELRGVECYSDEYKELRGKISDKLEELGEERSEIRYDEVLGDALKAVSDGEAELEKAKTDGKKELDDAFKKLEEAKQQITDGEKELEEAKKQIDSGKAQITEAENQLAETRTQLDAAKAELEKTKAALDEAKAKLDNAQNDLTDLLTSLMLSIMFDENYSVYESKLEQYNKGVKQYEENYKKYTEGEEAYKKGVEELAKRKAEFEKGLAEYENSKKALEEAKKQYEQGLSEYNDGKSEYETKITDAEKELSDAREEISNAGSAKWYVFTRDDNPAYTEYESNTKRIDRIALIFPIFFLLVAGLVCLTTMSRMVEEQRTQIGTLKALGYSRGAIMRHYMIYAVSAALVGGIIGAVIGCFLFPGVIVYAYSMLYNIKEVYFMFTAENLGVSIGSMTLAIALTVYFSCSKALKETPASLMRPKAPKAGKRVFIEKIPLIWKKMNFFAKVSARNLIRYKRRMIMTIVGIAGCTALSLTGFGLKNSIMDVARLQFNDIYRYSGYAAYKDDIKPEELESIYETLVEYEPDTDYTRALIKQYDMTFGEKNAQCYVTAVEDSELFEKLVDMRERKTGKKVSMSGGAVITEKASILLGVKVGDEITVKISDSESKQVTISAITEHYAAHYLYLTEDLFEQTFGNTPEYNMIYFSNNVSDDDDVQSEFIRHMLKNQNVSAVFMNAGSLNNLNETMKILDLVVLVLIASAAALAFVVLYNLSNVNITERIREIATLKVLGFYDIEVSSYVFRESIVLSLIGALVGMGLGHALCMFVVTTAELDEIMFGRTIHFPSYLLAFAVTTAFSIIVNLIMTKVLKKVSMVESLKSVE